MREHAVDEVHTRIVRSDALAETRHGDKSVAVQLVILAGPGAGRRLIIEDEIVIGRGGSATLRFDDVENVSRRHAKIERLPDDTWELVDLGSSNGTSLNGTKTTSAALRFGDKIRLGPDVVLLFARHDALEDQLFEAQRLQLVGQLSAGIAHDFNNVLAVVIANAGYADGDDLDAGELKESLHAIQVAARRGAALVDQLMVFAAPSRGDAPAARVADVVDEIVGMQRRTTPKTIRFESEVPPGLLVNCGSSALLQVLLNLTVNSADAINKAGVVRITAKPIDPDTPTSSGCQLPSSGPHVAISVMDSGTGMDAATLTRLFQPFFTTKPRGKGTGLGLATVSKIVNECGGLVDVSSVLGTGTRFDVYLPAAQPATSKPTSARSYDAQGLAGTVLIVDDDELLRQVLERFLSRRGLQTLTADSGLEAISVYGGREGAIDLVLLDLDLPDMRGERALDELRKIDPDVNVVISSGCADAPRLEALECRGVRSFLNKPFETRDLVNTLAPLLAVGQPNRVIG
jgi:signal transduction histidine kinase/ActR/RegA family two-component response regulator